LTIRHNKPFAYIQGLGFAIITQAVRLLMAGRICIPVRNANPVTVREENFCETNSIIMPRGLRFCKCVYISSAVCGGGGQRAKAVDMLAFLLGRASAVEFHIPDGFSHPCYRSSHGGWRV
jgi:hypothetical protein